MDNIPELKSEKKKLSEEVGYTYVEYHGVVYPPFIVPSAVDELRENFVPLKDDILIATYAKSGTAWVHQIVQLILNGGKDAVIDNSLWLEFMSSLGKINSTKLNLKETPPEGRRVLKTHNSYDLAPWKELPPETKLLFVARNPKDTCVSFYHHISRVPMHEYTGDFQHFLELFCTDKSNYGSWFEHTKGWFNASKKFPDQILFVTYEDLKLNGHETIKKIANFINVETSDDVIAEVVKKSSFGEMAKGHTEATFPRYTPKHFRKGEVGDWKNHFTVAQNEGFDKMYQETMGPLVEELNIKFTP